MKHTLQFGKVAYEGRGLNNAVEIDIELKDGRLSICGAIWGQKHYDCLSCGQNLEEISQLLPDNELLQRIVNIWRRWHLNDMKAGSPRQEEYLRQHPVNAVYPESHYEKASKLLADAGLNPDAEFRKGYQYGHAWIMEEIPADIVVEIESWFEPSAVA